MEHRIKVIVDGHTYTGHYTVTKEDVQVTSANNTGSGWRYVTPALNLLEAENVLRKMASEGRAHRQNQTLR